MRNRFNSDNLRFILLLCSSLVYCMSFSQKNEYFKTANNCILDKNEKVFVQLDKECFISGEELKFSSVILNASKLTTENVSKEVYFEIMNNSNLPVMDWHCSAQNGFSSGSIILPDSISFGIYTLKAYTNWMRNFSPELYFSKTIIISRLNDKIQGYIPYSVPDKKDPLISFFPEGGNLIEGLETNVAYRINNIDSSLINRLCIIKDIEGNPVHQFNISESGLGSFSFSPVPGKNYYAEIEDYTNLTGSKELEFPKSFPNGILLKVQNLKNLLRINVINKDASRANEKIKLIGINRGKVSYDTTLSSQAKVIQIDLPLNKFQPGITEFVITRGNYLISERYIYIEPSGLPSVDIKLPKTVYNSGEKADFEIDLNDIDESSVSVSISEFPHFNSFSSNRSFLKYMYFDSELTDLPASIANKDNITDIDADLVLLTIKDDQYAWNLYQKSDCIHLKETSGNVLKGWIKKHSNGEPIVGSLITMACIDSVSTLKYCYTDSTGKFLFLLDDYYDNKDIVFQINGYPRSQNDIEWEFENKDGRAVSSSISTYAFKNSELNYLSLCKNISLVEKVFQPKQRKSTKAYANNLVRKGSFYGEADAVVHPSDFMELIDFDDIAANIVPGIRFRSKGEKSSMQVYNLLKHELIPEESFVILNGIPYDDLGYIATLGTKLIKQIELVQSTVLYGDITCPGIVSISTYNYKIPGSYYNSSKYIYKNEIKSFPSSNSFNGNSPDSPNLKQTLYWNPSVVLHNKFTAGFSASDLKGKYELSVKGITKGGKLIEKTAIIEVK